MERKNRYRNVDVTKIGKGLLLLVNSEKVSGRL